MVGVSSSSVRLDITDIEGLSQQHGKILWHLRAIECLNVAGCDELTHFWESEEILGSLRTLNIFTSTSLVSFGKEKAARLESIRVVRLIGCWILESYNCPSNVEMLQMNDCPAVASLTFPTTDGLSCTLKKLMIYGCDVVDPCCLKRQLLEFLVSLESLEINRSMLNLKLLDKGYLNHLTRLTLDGCDNIVSIPEEGYGFLPCCCLEYLKISSCQNLTSFPHTILPMMESLEEVEIVCCPNLDYSVNWVGWPPNLKSLSIGGLKNPISEWRLQNLPNSLSKLSLYGDNLGVVSFAKIGFLLPPSLSCLKIHGFKKLKSISEGLQHLTCLEELHIFSCPELKDLPERLLPSLSSLWLSNTPKLIKKCDGKKGKYPRILSQIPRLEFW
ncbi:uncharacterized protein LOC143546465 [Bidens hawaiensis]|uniref:uncharacterized protein LOC143546465 n=1 Tax=Bidens hawaiensis TaxID=980011 RepID=UPI00404B6C35